MSQNIEVRVSLGEEDFRRLVMGRIVETECKVRGVPFFVQFALQDIGFDAMTLALRDAIEGHAVATMTASEAQDRLSGLAQSAEDAKREEPSKEDT